MVEYAAKQQVAKKWPLRPSSPPCSGPSKSAMRYVRRYTSPESYSSYLREAMTALASARCASLRLHDLPLPSTPKTPSSCSSHFAGSWNLDAIRFRNSPRFSSTERAILAAATDKKYLAALAKLVVGGWRSGVLTPRGFTRRDNWECLSLQKVREASRSSERRE